ncbi:MAG: B12-binding domain-containing radical SAM protein [Oscillospiraceae bacterium]|nr:B12-binding domain-containing radical SAM protein [Oscillospiraceae bacterium]
MIDSKRVLFIYPDFLEETKFVKTIPGNYSEGLASLSAVLKEGGHHVDLYHLTYMPDRAEFLAKVKGYAPDIIGISIRTSALPYAMEMAEWLDDEMPEIYVWAGMYHPSLAPEEVIILRGIDAVCIGEGESVCLDFVNYYSQHGTLDLNAESFWIMDSDGEIHKNPIRPFITDLDSLPFPDLDIFDYCNLRSNAQQNTAEVIVSRGCIFSCTYCANAQLRNIYPSKTNYARFRSPENAILLLERILEKDPSIEYFSFNDAILNVYKDWFYEFTALYKERIKKQYVCNLRIDLLDEQMIKELAESGCYLVTIGLENGNEEYRRKYLQRVMKNDHIVEVSHMLKSAGIIVNAYNIIGLPHETLELSLETIKLNAQMHTDNVIISMFTPYPTTKLRDIAEEAGFIDPSIDPNDPVKLRMPGYSRSDILYIRYSFDKLMRQYQKLYKTYTGEKLEQEIEKIDRRVLGERHPRALIGAVRNKKHWGIVYIKRVASQYLPSVYKMLRRKRDEKAAKNNSV